MTTTDEFDKIAEAYDKSQGGPVAGTDEKRRLYALYKQATAGDARGPQPGFFNFEEQNKFRAWKNLSGMPDSEARKKFVDLANELGYRDPGDSPVDWITDETWRREESWPSPDFDDPIPCINAPDTIEVSDDDRQRAPTVATGETAKLPAEGGPDEQRDRLAEQSPETLAFHLYEPNWPVCCRRLTVLVGYRGVDEEVSPVIPRTYQIDEDREEGWRANLDFSEPDVYGEETLRDGLLAFHCHDCGSVYLSSHDV